MHRSILSTVVAGLMALAGVAVGTPGTASAAPVGATVANANLKGVWTTVPSGIGFTITYENLTTGFCKGRSAYGPPYTMTHCHVSGQTYKLTLTVGRYREWYLGVLDGNTTTGHVHDSIGGIGTYTGTRP